MTRGHVCISDHVRTGKKNKPKSVFTHDELHASHRIIVKIVYFFFPPIVRDWASFSCTYGVRVSPIAFSVVLESTNCQTFGNEFPFCRYESILNERFDFTSPTVKNRLVVWFFKSTSVSELLYFKSKLYEKLKFILENM